MGSYRGKTGSPGSEQPFFPKVRARALTVTPTGEPVNFYYMPVGKSKQYLWDFREWVTLATFSVAAFPSLQRRGGCGINKKSRSHGNECSRGATWTDGRQQNPEPARQGFRRNAGERSQ